MLNRMAGSATQGHASGKIFDRIFKRGGLIGRCDKGSKAPKHTRRVRRKSYRPRGQGIFLNQV